METAIPCLIPSLTTPPLSTVVVADRDTRSAPSGCYKTLTSSQEEEMLARITPGVALITSQGHRHLSALPASPQLPMYRDRMGTANKAVTAGRLGEVVKIKRTSIAYNSECCY